MRFRLAAILGLLIIALAIVLAIVLTPAQRPVARESPPPASLIDIGGRKLHLYCTGVLHWCIALGRKVRL
jgi:hypothetical protein